MKLKIIGIIGVIIIFIVSCQSEDQVEFARYYSNGSTIYQSHCQNCHGVKGEGLQGLIPPLTDTAYLKNNKTTLACSVNYGLKGKITILNRAFEGEMPANDLAPIDIAKVLTYVTNSFGNKMGIITLTQVNENLAKCK
ncbi:c-type cytochrome [Mucilaginibacter sp.]|uniref:c-type cytochrome n=1 Tax=Mucilaginibacter sp. TaxID=1882438 RepID=UPI003D11840B